MPKAVIFIYLLPQSGTYALALYIASSVGIAKLSGSKFSRILGKVRVRIDVLHKAPLPIELKPSGSVNSVSDTQL